MQAAERWRAALEALAIPDEILARAPESPWGFPAELFRRRAERAAHTDDPDNPTTARALEALPQGGVVLDVGCGSGATSLPLAGRAGRLVGVDEQEDMLAAFVEAAGAPGSTTVEAVPGRWPEVAGKTPVADVVVSGHVLYNVADLEPFARALTEHASRRVVVELSAEHPLNWLGPLWLRFHDWERPPGPTASLAQEVLLSLGYAVKREGRERLGTRAGGFESREDAVALIRKRLCLTTDRDEELADALGDNLMETEDGLWSAGPPAQTMVTLWWDAGLS
jgi:SAM-dependent methyltransferase